MRFHYLTGPSGFFNDLHDTIRMLDRTKLETLPIHLIAAILNPPFSTAYSWTEFTHDPYPPFT